MDGPVVTLSAEEYARLNDKIDRLTEILEAQERRQRALVELKDDMTPVINQVVKLTIDELSEVGMDFQLEDLLFIVKRLLRNTKLIMRLVDQLEGLSDISDEVERLGPKVMSSVINLLDEYEQKGMFSLARGGLYVMEQVASNTSEEELKAIGDQVGPLVKKAGAAVEALSSEETKAPSLIGLLRQMNEPEVRLLLSRLLTAARALA